jgi:hypothetical protein
MVRERLAILRFKVSRITVWFAGNYLSFLCAPANLRFDALLWFLILDL